MVSMKRTLVVTDNALMFQNFTEIVRALVMREEIEYRRSTGAAEGILGELLPIDVRSNCEWIAANFGLIISLHCKQIFPKSLLESVLCINVHPGYIPDNRGWYPQVFSIINKKPLGASIHVMTEEIDFGSVIARKEVPVLAWDTSESAYDKVLEAECALLKEHLPAIFARSFSAALPTQKGNINRKKDFESLCRLNLEQTASYGQVIDHLRALSHSSHLNAYFDTTNGERIFVTIQLHRSDRPQKTSTEIPPANRGTK
jgi:dTDP-4-amino-4,6-dideoxyglucose formyltransferase